MPITRKSHSAKADGSMPSRVEEKPLPKVGKEDDSNLPENAMTIESTVRMAEPKKIEDSQSSTEKQTSARIQRQGTDESEGAIQETDILKARIQDLETRLQTREAEVTQLMTNVRSRDAKLRQLEQYGSNAQIWMQKAHQLEAQRAKDKVEIQKLQENQNKLREVVLEGAQAEETNDDALVQRFQKVRRMIQSIAHSPTLHVHSNAPLWAVSSEYFDLSAKDIEALWNCLALADRLLLLRAMLFALLDARIFNRFLFGIEDDEKALKPGEESSSATSKRFARFERDILKRKVPREVIADWRTATFRCIKLSGLSKERKGEYSLSVLTEFLEPLIPEGTPILDREKFWDRVTHLCKDAYDLQLSMRESREERYVIVVPVGSVLEDCLDRCEPFNILGGGQSMGETLAITLFGGLAKELTTDGTEIILEKAQVIMNPKEEFLDQDYRP